MEEVSHIQAFQPRETVSTEATKGYNQLASYVLDKFPNISGLLRIVYLIDYTYCSQTETGFTEMNWHYDHLLGKKQVSFQRLESVVLPPKMEYYADEILKVASLMHPSQLTDWALGTYPARHTQPGNPIRMVELTLEDLDNELEEVWEDIQTNHKDLMVALAK